MLAVQDVRLDPEARRVWRAGGEVTLSRKEFDLLHALMRRAGEVVSRAELMAQVWDTTFFTSSKTIDVHLGWLRRKLGEDAQRPVLITTHRGRGLRFETAAATGAPAPAETPVAVLDGPVAVLDGPVAGPVTGPLAEQLVD